MSDIHKLNNKAPFIPTVHVSHEVGSKVVAVLCIGGCLTCFHDQQSNHSYIIGRLSACNNNKDEDISLTVRKQAENGPSYYPTAVLMAAEQHYNMDVEMTTATSDRDEYVVADFFSLLHVLKQRNSFQDARSRRTAQQRVFDTTELTEMILAWLPLPSLLRVQSVSTPWRDLIRDSLILQQHLFFKPEKSDKVWLAEVANLPAQNHPLRRDYKSSLRVLAEISRASKFLTTYHGLIATPVRANHLFLHLDPFGGDPNDIDRKVDRGFIGEISLGNTFLQTISNHSMRDMLLTQPPVTSLCAEVLVRRQPLEEIPVGLMFPTSGDCGLYSAKIMETEGVRLRQIAEALEQMGMLHRAESIKLFMNGVVEPTDADEKEVRRRTDEWHREVQS